MVGLQCGRFRMGESGVCYILKTFIFILLVSLPCLAFTWVPNPTVWVQPGSGKTFYATTPSTYPSGVNTWTPTPTATPSNTPTATVTQTPTATALTVGSIGHTSAVTVYGSFVQCNALPTPTCVIITAP